MRYSRVYIDAMGYELPPVVVTSLELEGRLEAALRRAAPAGRAARSADRDRRAAVVGPGLPALRRGDGRGAARAGELERRGRTTSTC